jgi:hypothetical protein
MCVCVCACVCECGSEGGRDGEEERRVERRIGRTVMRFGRQKKKRAHMKKRAELHTSHKRNTHTHTEQREKIDRERENGRAFLTTQRGMESVGTQRRLARPDFYYPLSSLPPSPSHTLSVFYIFLCSVLQRGSPALSLNSLTVSRQ